MNRRRFSLIASIVAAAIALPVYAAENLQLVEQQIKAGMLYNFLKYTEWPAGRMPASGEPVVVCLLGGDPFGGHLRPMAGRTVNQQTIGVRTLPPGAEIQDCSLVVVHADLQSSWPDMQRRLAGQSVLTVSDMPGFASSGGMIEFTRTDNRIGVTINTDSVTAAHLVVQDRLLRLARTVGKTPPGR